MHRLGTNLPIHSVSSTTACKSFSACTCVETECPYDLNFTSFYTNWSAILTLVSFTLFLYAYFVTGKLNTLQSVFIIVTIANSVGVFVSSQLLIANVDLSTDYVTGQPVQAIDPSIVNDINYYNIFTHILPFLVGILMWVGLTSEHGLRVDSCKKTLWIYSTAFVVLFMLIYLIVPVKNEEDGSLHFFFDKINIVYRNPSFMIPLSLLILTLATLYVVCKTL